MEEIWRDIEGYKGLYQVSNMGRVRSLDRWITYKDGREALFKGKILHLNCNTSGYLEVNLCKQSKGKMIGVHRLVAQSFIDNVDNLPEVDHIDGDKTNNNVTNLRWVTHLDNCNNPSTTKNISAKIPLLEQISICTNYFDCGDNTIISALYTDGKRKNTVGSGYVHTLKRKRNVLRSYDRD